MEVSLTAYMFRHCVFLVQYRLLACVDVFSRACACRIVFVQSCTCGHVAGSLCFGFQNFYCHVLADMLLGNLCFGFQTLQLPKTAENEVEPPFR